MELKIPESQFVCIDYPCVVNDISKALGTLGGEKTITRTYLEPVRRLELRFRPHDIFCKPACADRKDFCGLLIKVRRRRSNVCDKMSRMSVDQRVQSREQDSVETRSNPETKIEGEVIGVVDTMYNFNSMLDFQFLPLTKTKDDGYKSLVQELVISKLESKSWLDEPAHLFLPPPTFSRYGRPIQYCFKEPPNPRDGIPKCSEMQSSIIGIARQRRPRFTAPFKFSQETVPDAPFPQAVDKLSRHQISAESIKQVNELFEHRPIWTRSALRSHLPHLTRDELQFILPTVSYYCLDGPWRTMWARFGYDMRKDPSSKIYQNLDFRLRRTTPGVNSVVPAKRSIFDFYLPNTVSKVYSQTSIIQKKSFLDVNPEELKNLPDPKEDQQMKEAAYKFRAGMIPPSRQMFYHLCDVEEPEVQRLVHSNDGLETECSERDGWCVAETVDKCRIILLGHIQRALTQRASEISSKNAEFVPRQPLLNPTEGSFGTEQGLNQTDPVQNVLQAADFSSSSSENEEEREDDEEEEDDDEMIDEEDVGNDKTLDEDDE